MTSETGLRELQSANVERAKRWHENAARDWSPLEWAGAMCGEAGEAANVAKKLLRLDLGMRGNEAAEHVITERDALIGKLASEIAGTVIYATLFAHACGIDFNDAIVSTFNEKSEAMGFPERLPVVDPELAHRQWALARVAKVPRVPLSCGHDGGFAYSTCVVCAHELGRREGQVEAGAYHTSDEVFAALRRESAA